MLVDDGVIYLFTLLTRLKDVSPPRGASGNARSSQICAARNTQGTWQGSQRTGNSEEATTPWYQQSGDDPASPSTSYNNHAGKDLSQSDGNSPCFSRLTQKTQPIWVSCCCRLVTWRGIQALLLAVYVQERLQATVLNARGAATGSINVVVDSRRKTSQN